MLDSFADDAELVQTVLLNEDGEDDPTVVAATLRLFRDCGMAATLADDIQRLHLTGWTVDDARVWWRELREEREGPADGKPTERTQLAVDVEDRR